ncbi:MAG: hypothetical protein JSR81_09190 [Proteobacteria bacterium]|nr:hypothetical protein [Pseudomonadota bacterium]
MTRRRFSDLEKNLSPKRRARIDRAATKLRKEMDLAKLRVARTRALAVLGQRLKIKSGYLLRYAQESARGVKMPVALTMAHRSAA